MAPGSGYERRELLSALSCGYPMYCLCSMSVVQEMLLEHRRLYHPSAAGDLRAARGETGAGTRRKPFLRRSEHPLLSGLPGVSFIQARWRTFLEIGGTSFGES